MTIDFEAIREANPMSAVASRSMNLQPSSGGWKACCPFHPDKTPSFYIFADDRHFRCFGGSCGLHGDVLDFVQLWAKVDVRGAAELLGGGGGWEPAVQRSAGKPAKSVVARSEAARKIWRRAVSAENTLAERYMRSRCLTLPIPSCIRFARLRYPNGDVLPAMVAAVSDPVGNVVAIQRTFLAPDGNGKASVAEAKISLGPIRGHAIRLTPPAERLIITEGFEDGATIRQATGEAVWVSAGAGMLASIVLPPEVREVIIGADRDHAGEDAARNAARVITRGGRTARIMRPREGTKDFNAQLMEDAA